MSPILIFLLLVSGCAGVDLGDFHSEGAQASAGCLKGGYALAGGQLTRAKVNDGFQGQIVITERCEISITSE